MRQAAEVTQAHPGAMADGELAEVVIAGDILRGDMPVIHPAASLNEALDRFARHVGERLPVVTDQRTQRLVGSLAKTDVILALAGSGQRSGGPNER